MDHPVILYIIWVSIFSYPYGWSEVKNSSKSHGTEKLKASRRVWFTN